MSVVADTFEAFRKQRQVDLYTIKASLVYIDNFRPVRAT